jgi:hypothetical protein
MNKEQQRIAIAEACGWKLVTDNPEYEPYWEDPKGNMVAVNNGVHRFPDYLNDLNAMHEAIMSLTLEEQCNMTEILRKDVIKFTAPTITATAAQRAEAFLKTLNLWDTP